jgi:hypothetical protein
MFRRTQAMIAVAALVLTVPAAKADTLIPGDPENHYLDDPHNRGAGQEYPLQSPSGKYSTSWTPRGPGAAVERDRLVSDSSAFPKI